MADLEGRIETLEESQRAVLKTLETIQISVSKLDAYFSGNGHLILSVERRKFRFAGSFRIPTALLTLGGTGGVVGILGTALHWW